MARGVNKVIILGTAGKDPEVRYTASGSAVASVSIATNEQWKDKQTGQKMERCEWHAVTFFGKLAEIAGEYLKKGSQVYIEGKIQTDKWQDQNGQDRYTTKIIANEMQLIGGKPADAVDNSKYQQQPGQQQPKKQQQNPPSNNFDDFDYDQDIPF